MSVTTEVPALLALDPVAQDLLFRDARTANTFTDEPVTEEQLQAIYDLAKWAPTAMNSQPLRLVAVRSKEARERLVGYMAEGNRAKTATAPLTVILAADVDFHEHLPRVFPHAPGLKDNFNDEQARAGLAGKQAWLQAGYFILAIRAAGLAAGPMSGFDAAGVDADLLAGTTLRSFAVVNIGQPGPDAWMQRNPRLEHKEVVSVL
ncbi:MAG: malonic semialdehyde reductase [Candidatus Nanopelagicales bacterium]|nr:malonic semialdehyde reductase [Candidatus Nanopelagicales bacterium]